MSGWPWPTNLHLKKVDGDGVFEELNIGEKVIGKETTERSLAITMPTTPGQYHITFGFFYGRGAECGDRFTINLIATRPDVQEEDFVDQKPKKVEEPKVEEEPKKEEFEPIEEEKPLNETMIIEEASLISEQSKLSFDECYQILKEEKGDIGAASARINEKK